MTVPQEAKPVDTHVRVPRELWAQFESVAQQEERSVSWAILHLARIGLREKTRKHAPRAEASAD